MEQCRCGGRYSLIRYRLRCRPRRWALVVVRCYWSGIRVCRVDSIHVRAGSGVRINGAGVGVRTIRVCRFICVDRFVRVPVSITVRVFVGVLRPRPLRFVLGICRRVGVAILARLIGRDFLGRLACFGNATDVHRDRLAGFHDFAGAWQLKHHGVGLCFVAGPGRTNAKLEIGVSQNLLCFETVLANHVGHFHFRAAQRKIDSGRYSEKENECDRNDDCDAAEDGCNSGN